MNKEQLDAVVEFAKYLMLSFPIIEKPANQFDEIKNIFNKRAQELIQIGIERAELLWELEVAKDFAID
jgi:hypothetical protein